MSGSAMPPDISKNYIGTMLKSIRASMELLQAVASDMAEMQESLSRNISNPETI